MKHLLILLKFSNLSERSKVAETDKGQKQFSNTFLSRPRWKLMAISYRYVIHLVHSCIRFKSDKITLDYYFLIETKLVTAEIESIPHWNQN